MRITIIGYSVVLLFDITEALSTDPEEVVRRLNTLSGGIYSRNDNLHMEKSNIYKSKVYITSISKHKTYADEG
jgi:hypothetical protein